MKLSVKKEGSWVFGSADCSGDARGGRRRRMALGCEPPEKLRDGSHGRFQFLLLPEFMVRRK